jgi:hypothetical protein
LAVLAVAKNIGIIESFESSEAFAQSETKETEGGGFDGTLFPFGLRITGRAERSFPHASATSQTIRQRRQRGKGCSSLLESGFQSCFAKALAKA